MGKWLRLVFLSLVMPHLVLSRSQTADPAPPWVLVVNSTEDRKVPGHGREFVPLMRSIPGWEKTPAEHIWVGDLNPKFLASKPKPLAIFFSGSFKDWCEVDRNDWKGVEEILKQANVPIWASCGGAQALAIIAENGTNGKWDCPHCRDPIHPATPIYTHIGHTGGSAKLKCGDYANCIFERGLFNVKKVKADPVFAGLPEQFEVMESHCGQIEWAPHGWELVAGAGEGSKTKTQCLKLIGKPIYAAQFHIEMAGAEANTRLIMSNFLSVASRWRSEQQEPRKPQSSE